MPPLAPLLPVRVDEPASPNRPGMFVTAFVIIGRTMGRSSASAAICENARSAMSVKDFQKSFVLPVRVSNSASAPKSTIRSVERPIARSTSSR